MDLNVSQLAGVVRARQLAKRATLLELARSSGRRTSGLIMLQGASAYVVGALLERWGLAAHTFFPALLFFWMSGHAVRLHQRLDSVVSIVESELDGVEARREAP